MGVFSVIIPAAGFSRRMGFSKTALIWQGKNLLQALMERYLSCGVEEVRLVLRPEQQAELPKNLPAYHPFFQTQPGAEMIDSIRLALPVEEKEEAFFIQPGDGPPPEEKTLSLMKAAFLQEPDRLHVATFQGQRGHPLLLGSRWFGLVHSASCNNGLRELLRHHPDQVHEVESADGGCLKNWNHPEEIEETALP